MNTKYSPQDWQRISEYLDGQLSLKEKSRLEARFQTEPDLNMAYLELRQTKILLKSAKNLNTPRSFTITEAQALTIKPVRKNRFLPVLSLSSVLATVLMIFAIFFEMNSGANFTAKVANEQPAASLAMESAPMDSRAFEGNPMIIQWGGNQAYGMGGGGGDSTSLGVGGGAVQNDLLTKSMNETPGVGGADPGAINIMPTPAPTQEAAILTAPVEIPGPITGTGPILGIRSGEEADSYNQAVMSDIQTQSAARQSAKKVAIPFLRWIQIGLAMLAIFTGGTATYLWRKSRI